MLSPRRLLSAALLGVLALSLASPLRALDDESGAHFAYSLG